MTPHLPAPRSCQRGFPLPPRTQYAHRHSRGRLESQTAHQHQTPYWWVEWVWDPPQTLCGCVCVCVCEVGGSVYIQYTSYQNARHAHPTYVQQHCHWCESDNCVQFLKWTEILLFHVINVHNIMCWPCRYVVARPLLTACIYTVLLYSGKFSIRWVYFRYGEPQKHENLDIRIVAWDYCSDVVQIYNENNTTKIRFSWPDHENTFSRPDNENLTQQRCPAIRYMHVLTCCWDIWLLDLL